MKAVKKTAVNVGRLFVVIIAVIIALGTAIGVTALIDSISAIKTKQVITAYTIGGLDESGQHVKSNNTIYSDLFECQGLKITQAFDSADMTFQVFYYYENEDFAESSDIIDSGYYEPESIPDDVMFARVLIIPNDMPVISWYNKYQYYSGLKIEVDIEQTVTYNNILDDNYVVKAEGFKSNLERDESGKATGNIEMSNDSSYYVYLIDFSKLNLKAGDKLRVHYVEGLPTKENETIRFVSGSYSQTDDSFDFNLVNKKSFYLKSFMVDSDSIIEVPEHSGINYILITVNGADNDMIELYKIYER